MKRQHNESQALEDAVMTAFGVQCFVRIKKDEVSVRTQDYPDFVMARSIIRQRTGLEVVRDLEKPEA